MQHSGNQWVLNLMSSAQDWRFDEPIVEERSGRHNRLDLPVQFNLSIEELFPILTCRSSHTVCLQQAAIKEVQEGFVNTSILP